LLECKQPKTVLCEFFLFVSAAQKVPFSLSFSWLLLGLLSLQRARNCAHLLVVPIWLSARPKLRAKEAKLGEEDEQRRIAKEE